MTYWIKEHVRTLSRLSKLAPASAERLFLQPVRVELDKRMQGNPTYRVAYHYGLNLISRMFPLVQFEAVADEPLLILPWGSGTLVSEKQQAEFTLVFGSAYGPQNSQRTVTANCHNWSVYVDTPIDADSKESWNPILALVTACYAAARCTQLLLGEVVEGETHWRPFSILDFADGKTEFDWSAELPLGEAHLAGIGAIGSGFLYALAAHQRAKGKLVLVDHDRVELSNLGRYTFFDAQDEGQFKTVAAKRRLEKFGLALDVIPVEKRFEEYFKESYGSYSGFRVENLISAPDRRSTRRRFQRFLPRRMWDASTGPNQVTVHSNSFDRELACAECIYPETPDERARERHIAASLNVDLERIESGEPIKEIDAKKIVQKYPEQSIEELVGKAFDSVFRNLCSAGELRLAGEIVHAPFSFVSGLAGVLLYFEFVKSLRPEAFGAFRNCNYFQVNPLRLPNPEFREERGSRRECMCQKDEFRTVYNRLWGVT